MGPTTTLWLVFVSIYLAVAKGGGGLRPECNVTLVMVRLSNDMIVLFSRHHDSSFTGKAGDSLAVCLCVLSSFDCGASYVITAGWF